MSADTKTIKSGPGAAAMISAGIGSLFLGLMTTGAVISVDLKNALSLYAPAGPLSGKTTVAFAAWLLSWVILGTIWKDKDFNFSRAFTITLILVGIGFLLTFPPIFEAFE
ncbi:MAG: hypothetical protein WD751_08260 [Anaerolineales bacterium]